MSETEKKAGFAEIGEMEKALTEPQKRLVEAYAAGMLAGAKMQQSEKGAKSA